MGLSWALGQNKVDLLDVTLVCEDDIHTYRQTDRQTDRQAQTSLLDVVMVDATFLPFANFCPSSKIFEIFSCGGKGKPLLNDSCGGVRCVSLCLRVLLCPLLFFYLLRAGIPVLSFEGATEFVTSLFLSTVHCTPFEELECVAIEIVPDRQRCAVKVKMAIVRGISCLFIRIQGCPWAEGGDKGNLTP